MNSVRLYVSGTAAPKTKFMFNTEYDGAGLDYLSLALILEEIAAGDGATSTVVSVNNCPVCSILMAFANEDQKQRFLKPLARGDIAAWLRTVSSHIVLSA